MGFSSVRGPTLVAADPWISIDGRLNAPAGPPQHPTWLNGGLGSYAVRSPWQCAGIGYRTGTALGQILKHPVTDAGQLPAGVTTNTSTKNIFMDTARQTFDGWDLTQDGGWGLTVRASECTVSNSHILVGANNNIPFLIQGGFKTKVRNTIIDGANRDWVGGGLIWDQSGGLDCQYCWLKNSGGDIWQVSPGWLNLKFNLIEKDGGVVGAHGDWIQMGGAAAEIYPYIDVGFNTCYQDGDQIEGTQGLQLEVNAGILIGSSDVHHNTMFHRPGVVRSDAGTFFTGIDPASIVGLARFHDNYADPTYSFTAITGEFARGGSSAAGKTLFYDNWNMINGAAFPTTY